MLGLLSRLSRDFKNPLCVFCLFSRTKLDFGSVIWNSLTASDASRIESVQKRFVRIVYDSILIEGVIMITNIFLPL